MVVNVNTKHKTKTSQTCILTLLIFVLFKKEAVLSRLISTQGTLRMFFFRYWFRKYRNVLGNSMVRKFFRNYFGSF